MLWMVALVCWLWVLFTFNSADYVALTYPEFGIKSRLPPTPTALDWYKGQRMKLQTLGMQLQRQRKECYRELDLRWHDQELEIVHTLLNSLQKHINRLEATHDN